MGRILAAAVCAVVAQTIMLGLLDPVVAATAWLITFKAGAIASPIVFCNNGWVTAEAVCVAEFKMPATDERGLDAPVSTLDAFSNTLIPLFTMEDRSGTAGSCYILNF